MLLVDFIAAGFSEELFWDSTPRQITGHFEAARKRMRRDHNARMEQAWWAGVVAKSSDTPKLKDLLVDVDAKPRGRQSWQEIKAGLMIALPPKPKEI